MNPDEAKAAHLIREREEMRRCVTFLVELTNEDPPSIEKTTAIIELLEQAIEIARHGVR